MSIEDDRLDVRHSVLFSWIQVMYDFVMNDKVGPWARVSRPTKIGRESVISQREYEQQLKQAVKTAQQNE